MLNISRSNVFGKFVLIVWKPSIVHKSRENYINTLYIQCHHRHKHKAMVVWEKGISQRNQLYYYITLYTLAVKMFGLAGLFMMFQRAGMGREGCHSQKHFNMYLILMR